MSFCNVSKRVKHPVVVTVVAEFVAAAVALAVVVVTICWVDPPLTDSSIFTFIEKA